MCTKRPQALKTRVSFDKFWIKFEIKWQNINVGIPRRSFLPFSAFPAVRGNAEKVTSLIFLVCALNGMRIHQMRLVCLKGKRLASRMTPTRIAYVVYLACYGRQKKSLRRSPNFPYSRNTSATNQNSTSTKNPQTSQNSQTSQRGKSKVDSKPTFGMQCKVARKLKTCRLAC